MNLHWTKKQTHSKDGATSFQRSWFTYSSPTFNTLSGLKKEIV